MRPIVSTLALAGALALSPTAGLAQAAGGGPKGEKGPEAGMHHHHTMLTLTGEAEVKAAPDVAMISVGVQTEAPVAASATADNAKRMAAVMAALKKAGVAEKDVQTSNISVNPQYVYVEREPPKVTGYQAVNTVSVKVRDLKNLGRALDAVVSAGSNQIHGVSFALDNPDAAMDQARREAIAKVRARADLYASAVGMKVARIVAIQEGGAAMPGPIPVPVMARAAMEKMDTPISPGEVAANAMVTVVFALEEAR